MLDRPLIPVYTEYQEVQNACVNMTCIILFPWFICETMATRILSFLLMYGAFLASIHRHYEFKPEPAVIICYLIISLLVNVTFSRDLPSAAKTII